MFPNKELIEAARKILAENAVVSNPMAEDERDLETSYDPATGVGPDNEPVAIEEKPVEEGKVIGSVPVAEHAFNLLYRLRDMISDRDAALIIADELEKAITDLINLGE